MNPSSGVNPALARLQASVRIGGKGTVRRKKKVVHKTTTTDDKRLQNTLKRLGINSIPAIEEVNLFLDQGDKSVLPSLKKIADEYQQSGGAEGEDSDDDDAIPDLVPQTFDVPSN